MKFSIIVHPSVDDVINIHRDVIENYSDPGYIMIELSFNIVNRSGLESAVAMPKMTSYGQLLYPTIAEMSSAYCWFLTKNHPFQDGNKRTAVNSMLAFLECNGFPLTLDTQKWIPLIEGVQSREQIRDEIVREIGFDTDIEL
jgi:death-on-curing protein